MPLMDETRGFLSAERVAKMKKGARLVHAARGGIVDEAAVCAALTDGRLAGAALDVFDQEPLPQDSPLRAAPNLILTPHLGASTHEAKHNVSVEMAKQVALCLQKGTALNGVNVPRIAPSDAAIVGPWLSLAHNLASFLTQAFSGTLSSLRLTVQGTVAEQSQKALLASAAVGALKPTTQGAVTSVNAERIAKDRGIRVHCEQATMKRDFVNLIRVEAVLGEVRHSATGAVFGNRHGRMVELDGYVLDAIPEAPLLVTFHDDQPGVVGKLGTLLGEASINITRMQIGQSDEEGKPAMAICNLDRALDAAQLGSIRALAPIRSAASVR
jgi:D-3-phosphoglycerate dehydrogenase